MTIPKRTATDSPAEGGLLRVFFDGGSHLDVLPGSTVVTTDGGYPVLVIGPDTDLKDVAFTVEPAAPPEKEKPKPKPEPTATKTPTKTATKTPTKTAEKTAEKTATKGSAKK